MLTESAVPRQNNQLISMFGLVNLVVLVFTLLVEGFSPAVRETYPVPEKMNIKQNKTKHGKDFFNWSFCSI